MCIALVHQICGCCIIILEAFYPGNVFPFTITSVISTALRGPSGRFLTGSRQKSLVNHPKTRQKRAGSVAACMSMRTSAYDGNSRHSARARPVSSVLPIIRKAVNEGPQFVAWPWKRYRSSRKTGFPPVQESRVRRRPAITLLASRRTTNPTFAGGFDSWLDPRSRTFCHKTPKRRFDSRVKSS